LKCATQQIICIDKRIVAVSTAVASLYTTLYFTKLVAHIVK
jgi:hypothetical protein